MSKYLFVLIAFFFGCKDTPHVSTSYVEANASTGVERAGKTLSSWQLFLKNLPQTKGAILDFNGNPVPDQAKHVAVIDYDVGKRDLQQCADAIMRLRAEYLFGENRSGEIGFHFVSGDFYSWKMYCKGLRPMLKSGKLVFTQSTPSDQDHNSLRRYLDLVYTYANTVSLAKELKATKELAIGTIIIQPGFPGHTCIIIDEKTDLHGRKLFKLAEGFMPAQSIYVLSNPDNKSSPWYALNGGTIRTASYTFDNYQLCSFE